jgi:hypothetical protein
MQDHNRNLIAVANVNANEQEIRNTIVIVMMIATVLLYNQ